MAEAARTVPRALAQFRTMRQIESGREGRRNMAAENDIERRTSRFRLSQETVAIVSVGVALAGLILASVGDFREEARADRTAWQAESRQIRDEARAADAADRENFQRQMETFQRQMEALQRQVVGLSIEQARLAAVVDQE